MLKRQFYIVVLLVGLVCPLNAQTLKSLLDKGDRMLNKSDYENALTSFLEAYKLAPDDPEVNFRVGVCYLHGERKGKAVPYLEKAFTLKPEVDLDIDYHLGLAYQNDHQYSKAIERFK